jgi:DNA-binding XRE family transcriptional regulator
MTDEEALLTLGLLVIEVRERDRDNRVQAAEKIGLNYKTLQDVEKGHRLPNRSTLSAIERAYGWSEGSLLGIWEKRRSLEFGSVHAVDLRLKPSEIPVPLAKASELSTEELLAELSFRVLVMSRQEQKEDSQ